MDLNSRNGEWEDEAPTLSGIERTTPFSVPSNYFEELGDQLQARISIERAEAGETGFGVPGGYFEELGERIISSVKAEEFKQEAGEHGFIAPAGYFESLHENILKKAAGADKKVKVRRMWPSWIRYAAAACVAVVVGTGFFFMRSNNSIDTRLSKIPEDEIVNYLQTSSDSGDFPVIVESLSNQNVSLESDLSDKEIKEYLESTL